MTKITINDFAKKAYKKYIEAGMTPAGACGLIGNQYAESAGFIAKTVEFLCIKKLKENGKIYTQDTYYKAVDSGEISKADFLNPLPGKRYGFGLAQWTTVERKRGLYERTVEKGKSIADEDIQLDYVLYELNNTFPKTFNVLKTAKTVKEASDYVLIHYEAPADTGTTMKNTRADYGQQYYDYFISNSKEGDSLTKNEAIQKFINVAEEELGYLEKKSNSQLDSKTGNAGSKNYTKYWRDVYPQYQGQPWCACFVSYCLMKAFGKETATKLLKHWPFVYCPTLGSLHTKNANPKVGDIVLFYRNGTFAHTGLVTKVSGDRFWTIEGNASTAEGITPNGGGVVAKSYYNTKLPGTKFVTPDWSLVSSISTSTSSNTKPSTSTSTSTPLNESVKWTGTTTSKLNVRTWAGSEYGTCSFSPLKKGAKIGVCDVVQASDGSEWYFIEYQGKKGFVSGKYVEKAGETSDSSSASTISYTQKQFIKDIQSAIGASVDGIAGSETLSKTVTVSSSKNRNHAVVKPIQKYLYALGYTVVGNADGDAGQLFTKAVNQYQKEVLKYTSQDGEITAKGKMWKSLLGMI